MSSEAVKLHGMVPRHLKVRQNRILLDSLEVMADIGFHDFEIGAPQRLLITVEVWLEDIAAPNEDHRDAAWNYDFLRDEVKRLAAARRYNLQETLVHAIFERIAEAHGVAAIRVKSIKPDVYPDAAGVGIEVSSFARTAG